MSRFARTKDRYGGPFAFSRFE